MRGGGSLSMGTGTPEGGRWGAWGPSETPARPQAVKGTIGDGAGNGMETQDSMENRGMRWAMPGAFHSFGCHNPPPME